MLSLTACAVESANTSVEVEPQTEDFYVNDFANLFTDAQKEELMENAISLHDEYDGIQVVITTIESLNGISISDYAYSMYNQYEVGKDGMGVLIVFSTNDREVMLATGEKMEAYITDSISGRLIDNNGLEDFKENNFSTGLTKLQKAVISYITTNIPADWNKEEKEQSETPSMHDTDKVEVQEVIPNDAPDDNANSKNHWPLLGGLVAFILAIIAFIKSMFSYKNYKKLYLESTDEIKSIKKAHSQELTDIVQKHKSELLDVRNEYDSDISQLQKEYSSLLQDRRTEIDQLSSQVNEKTEEISKLSQSLNEMIEKYRRIQTLHPQIEDEIQEMIQQEFKAEAQELDSKLASVVTLPADKERVTIFKDALDCIAAANAGVSQYLTVDKNALNQLYQDSMSLQAEFQRQQKEIADRKAAEEVLNEIDTILRRYSVGDHSNFDDFQEVFQLYTMLSTVQQQYLSEGNERTKAQFLHCVDDARADHQLFEAAKQAEQKINDVICHIHRGTEDNQDRLSKAMRYYKDLSSSESKYFDANILSTLKRLIREAENDHEEQERKRRQKREEEERRRRAQSSYHSSTMSHSSFGHSGYSGSRTSGGGAKRGF